MAVDYTALANVAEQLIDENGRAITIRTRSGTLPNPAEPWKPAAGGTGTPIATIGFFDNYDNDERGLTQIQDGDKRLLVKAKGLAASITLDDEIVDGTQIWQIVNVNEITPAAVAIYYELQVRL